MQIGIWVGLAAGAGVGWVLSWLGVIGIWVGLAAGAGVGWVLSWLGVEGWPPFAVGGVVFFFTSFLVQKFIEDD